MGENQPVVDRTTTTILIETLGDGTYRASQEGLSYEGVGCNPARAVERLAATVAEEHYNE